VNQAAAERISPQQTEKYQVAEFRERTSRKLRDLRCPVHGQAPRLRFHGSSLRDVTIQMSGCCDALIGLANRRIAQH
jgi:hypothetical protein